MLMGHSVGSWGERQCRIGALPLLGSACGASRVFQVPSLLIHLKHKSGN